MFKPFEESLDTFIKERNWNQYHHIRNAAMGFSCEVAELIELFTLFVYEDELEEVEKEIGDCFISLFSLYRVINFDIHEHLESTSLVEKTAYDALLATHNKASSPDFLVKYLSLRAGFLQEPFLWISDEQSINYNKILPVKTLVEPFNILLSLCYLLNFKAIDAMNKKLILAAEKYSVEFSKDRDFFDKVKDKKMKKRGT